MTNMNPTQWRIANGKPNPWMQRIRYKDSVYQVESRTFDGYRMVRVEGPGCYTRETPILFSFDHPIMTEGEVIHV